MADKKYTNVYKYNSNAQRLKLKIPSSKKCEYKPMDRGLKEPRYRKSRKKT